MIEDLIKKISESDGVMVAEIGDGVRCSFNVVPECNFRDDMLVIGDTDAFVEISTSAPCEEWDYDGVVFKTGGCSCIVCPF